MVGYVLAATLAMGCAEAFGAPARSKPTPEPEPPQLSGRTWPLVQYGDEGRNVFTVQYLLRSHGEPLDVNGLFDEATEQATRQFQAARELADDGIVGNDTWQELIVTLDQAVSGDAVRALQDQLRHRYGHGVAVTGTFAAITDRHVRELQASACLEYVDGVVGPETWYALIAQISKCIGQGGAASARNILDAHQSGAIELRAWNFGRRDSADPLSNLTDAANGQAARTSCYGTAPCKPVYLDDRLLIALESLIYTHGFRFIVTSVAGASHSTRSHHYAGRAVDFGTVNGVPIYGDSPQARALMAACRATGAIEVLGPSNDPVGHYDHVHCAW